MAVVRTIDDRVVLKRSKESAFLHAIGVGAVAVLPLVAVWFIVDAWRYRSMFDGLAGLVLLGLAIPFTAVLLDQYFLKLILSDTHISIQTWHGRPWVYTYRDVADIENVVEKAWSGSHVKLTFEDGRTVKIGNGLITAREFRKLLREKSGRTFRKKRSKRS